MSKVFGSRGAEHLAKGSGKRGGAEVVNRAPQEKR